MTPEERAEATRAVVQRMEEALAVNSDDMASHFHEDFRWMGNQGCGTKSSLAEFRRNWQLPLRAAFTDRDYKTERFVCEDDWASCFGHIEATHSGPFMGIAPTGKRVTIPYMDFWKIEDGRIKDNWVSVDFPSVLAQLGRDVFDGHGWEHFDDGSQTPPHPEGGART
ncbi:polyketide cyclase [Rhodobacterales bacterium HKCCE3408]|nr:polyketide cyclase [Rhodobacterales bacterium HKCCE3408]